MEEISVSRFKMHCLSIVEQVRQTKQPVRIVQNGKPVADLVPAEAASEEKNSSARKSASEAEARLARK